MSLIPGSLADPPITESDPFDKLLCFCGGYDIVGCHLYVILLK